MTRGTDRRTIPTGAPAGRRVATPSLTEIGPAIPPGSHAHAAQHGRRAGRALCPAHAASGHRVELCVYVDAVFEPARVAGFVTHVVPTDMPWGERTAWIADPDGNLVMLTR